MAAKPKSDTQAILDEWQNLRMQNVGKDDARKFLAEKYGRTTDSIRCLVNRGRASKDAPAIESDPLKDDFSAFGTSTLYDAEGKVKLQWVKRKKQEEEEQFRIAIEAMIEPIPKAKPVPRSSVKFREDVLAAYPMGDPHFGMYAWAEEAGEDFDLQIAERNLCAAVARLVDTVPAPRH